MPRRTWWHIPRGERRNRTAYSLWWGRMWAHAFGYGVVKPTKEWFAIKVTPMSDLVETEVR